MEKIKEILRKEKSRILEDKKISVEEKKLLLLLIVQLQAELNEFDNVWL